MDRGRQQRHSAVLRILPLAGILAAGLLFARTGVLRAQVPATASPAPSVAASPSAPPAADAAARKRMVERRQRELNDQEAQKRIEQLPPDEQAAFRRNLRVWNKISPDERSAVRNEVDERMKAEVEKAYQESGLHLDKDRREVFGLRYRQERRKLERELQEKLEAERARRLPAIDEELRREFAEKSGGATPSVSVAATPAASASRPTPSVSVPAAR